MPPVAAAHAEGTATGTEIPLTYLVDWSQANVKIPLKSETLIGRSSGFHGKGISKKHCLIKLHENKVFIADLNSTNGTYVNGVKLGVNKWQRLVDGDTLTLGEFDFHIETGITKSVTRSITKTAASTSRTVKTATHPVEKTERLVAAPSPGEEFVQASYALRTLATFADFLVIGLVWYVMAKLFPAGLALALGETLLLATFLLLPLYFFGQSFGKKILGLRVLQSLGARPGMQTLVVRELGLKLALPLAVLIALEYVGSVNFGSMCILALGGLAFFALKTKDDGLLFWDDLCKTRVISE